MPEVHRTPSTAALTGVDAALRIVDRLFRGFDGPARLRLWDDTVPRHDVEAVAPARPAARFSHRHSRESDRAAISFHHDVSNAFYGLRLDEQRIYVPTSPIPTTRWTRRSATSSSTCAASCGCARGALVCRAARHHGAHAYGITLSQRQFDFARRRIRDEGLEDRVTVELRDFRDLSADTVYDKVSSIGLFLNHGVTHEEEGWNRTVAAELINRDVFPDAELDRVGDIQSGMERAGFEILDVEGPRPHHVLTLKHWVERLDAHRDAAIREKDRVVPRSRHSRPRS